MLTITELIDAVNELIDRKPGGDHHEIEQRIDIGVESLGGCRPRIVFALDLLDRSRGGLRILTTSGETTDEILRHVREHLFPSSIVCTADDLNESLHDFLEQ